MEALYAIYQIVDLLASVFIWLIIIQFIIGLLFAFNVINSSNEFLATFYNSINRFLEPVLAPVRRLLPSAGGIDFSPLVIIIGLQILLIVLQAIMRGAA